jgi:prolyl-tRNA synthetase
MGARVLAADGSEVPIVMGSYGIGVSRCVAAIVEAHYDDNGICWPLSVAPFQVTVLTLGPEPELAEAAERLVADLTARGVEVLYDDRDERAGVKFKDADLIGVPIRIGVGRRGLADGGQVEWKLRADAQSELMTPEAVVERAVSLCAGIRAG